MSSSDASEMSVQTMNSAPAWPIAVGIDARSLVAVLFAVAFLAMAAQLMWDVFPHDLSALYMAGYFFAEGRLDLIYHAPPGFFGAAPPDWAPFLPELGLADKIPLPYVYPPLWAALLGPVTQALDPYTFFRAVLVIELAMMGASIWLAWRLAGRFAVPFWVWTLISVALMATSTITYTALMHMQPQIVVCFLIFAAFERYGAGAFRVAGVVLGLAAMLKLAPAALALIFVLDRNARALVAFGVTCATLGLAGVMIAGWPLHLAFLDSVAAAGDGLFASAVTLSAQALLYVIAELAGLVAMTPPGAQDFRVDPGAVIPVLNKVIAVLGLIWMIRVTGALTPQKRLVARVFLLSLLLNLFGPLGWVHYYLPQLFLLPMLIMAMPGRSGLFVLIGFAITTSWGMALIDAIREMSDLRVAAMNAGIMAALFVAVTRGLRQSKG